MAETILNASARAKQSSKFREKGFVPGVIYGDSITDADSVKFETLALKKVIDKHGANAKVWIMYNDTKKFGFIKEVQRDGVTGSVRHIDVQIVSKGRVMELEIPVIFKGEDSLARTGLQLQVYKAIVPVSGTMDLMPDAIYVDVADMQLGDSITLNNLGLDPKLEVLDHDDAVYGMIIGQATEETAEAAAE